MFNAFLYGTIFLCNGLAQIDAESESNSDVFGEIDYHAELKRYNQELEEHPERVAALYGRADCYFHLAKQDKAFEDVEAVLKIAPEHYNAWALRGDICVNRDQYPEAAKSYSRVRDILQSTVDNSFDTSLAARRILFGAATAGYNVGAYEQAAGLFTKITHEDRSDPDVYFRRGTCWLRLGQFEKAIQDFKAMKRHTPTEEQHRVHARMAAAYSMCGMVDEMYEELDAYYRNVIRHHAENEELFLQATIYETAYFQAYKKDNESASKIAKDGVERFPDSGAMRFAKGMSELSREEFDAAAQDFQQAVQLGLSDELHIELNSAMIALYSTFPDDAVRNVRKAEEYALSNCELTNYEKPEHLAAYAETLAQEGRFDEARQWLRKSIELAPPEAVVLLQRIMIGYEKMQPYVTEKKIKKDRIYAPQWTPSFGLPSAFSISPR